MFCNITGTGITWKASPTATPVSLIGNATYYPFGPLNVLTYGNGRTLTRTYDQDYAIDSVASSDPNGLVLDLTTDVMGNIIHARDTLGAPTPTRTYTYDRLYRLTGVQDGASALQEGFTYTKTGDRTSKALAGQAPQVYSYLANSHRLDDIDGVPRSYDANGNTTGMPNVQYLTYDDRNRLATTGFIGINGGTGVSYHYNGRGERVRKNLTTFTTGTDQTTLYDESGRVLHAFTRHTCGGGSSSFGTGQNLNVLPCGGSRTVEIVYLDDTPVAQITDGAISYLETDHLGTPRIAADPATNAWQWKWNFFGSAFGDHQPTQPTTGGIEVSLRYPGQQYDAEAGLHYNMARDYEPTTGRYIESDPIGLEGGIATYAYAVSDPLARSDPRGLHSAAAGSAAAGAAAGAAAARICMRVPSCKRQFAKLLKEAKELCEDVRCTFRRDVKPHYFPLLGYCQHYQIDCYIKGRSGSHFSWRTPIPYACRDTPGWVDAPDSFLP